jgi:XrtN system VIT domain protein|tara:strand:+ start:2298 stop:4829 length:2532 start_codon:yes stop_codon:yes gene_type:complete
MSKIKQLTPSQMKANELIFGLGIALFSLTTFVYFSIKEMKIGGNKFIDNEALVFINYIISVFYFITIVVNSVISNGWRIARLDRRHFSAATALLCISAYTLNLQFDVFEEFSFWSEISLFFILIPLLLIGYYPKFPLIAKWMYSFVVGFGIVLSLYFVIYLLPAIPIAFIAIIILGFGIHFFAPAILVATFITQYIKLKPTRNEVFGLFMGVITPLIILIYFSVNWNIARNKIEALNSITTEATEDFPRWYLLSQQLEQDYFVDLVLQGNLAFSTPKNTDVSRLINSGGGNTLLGDRFNHDPLIFTSALFGGEIKLKKSIRFKLLESLYVSRHNTVEKLWTGKDLETKSIENNVQIFPEHRLAYNEKTITIHNGRKKRWRKQQEALYTFHLPEGAAMTSLSLWVDGVERQSRLTTKKKATNAYNKIVGVERRDPAIAHWREGNRVTVTIFPCTPKEDRVFKVGITSPLFIKNKTLSYSDTYLEGPILNSAEVVSNIEIIGNAKNINTPYSFNTISENAFQYSGEFNNNLIITMDAPELSNEPFCFNGKCYKLSPTKTQNKFKDYSNVYLDINKAWTNEEVSAAMETFKDKNIFIYNGTITQITNPKATELTTVQRFNFNHIPLYLMDSTKTLIITKNSGVSPNLNDLKKTGFGVKTNQFISSTKIIPDIYSLNNLNDFWSTLNQLQLVNVAYGNLSQLGEMAAEHRFPSKSIAENLVYIDQAKMTITQVDSGLNSKSPDHLLRLFAYNQILQKVGRKYYNKEQYEDDLIPIANEAFVLSPISSMIVLETDKDYDDNGIKKNKNSLSNAKMKSSGSVPEPHEWVLICLAGMTLIYVYKKRRAIA